MIFSNIRGTTHDKFYIGNTSTIVDVANGKELKVQENVEFSTQSNTIIFGFDAASNKYQPISDNNARLGNITFSGLNNSATFTFGSANVDFSNASANNVLLFDGTSWVAGSAPSSGGGRLHQKLSLGPSNYAVYQTSYAKTNLITGINPGEKLVIDKFSISLPTSSFIRFDVFLVDTSNTNEPLVNDTQLFGYVDNNLALTQLPIPLDSSVDRTYSASSFFVSSTTQSALAVFFYTNLLTTIPPHTVEIIYSIV
ncbi:MAG: hypothetical protein QXT45_04390 [Candidatus Bilamarchaeaceae archaeon]